MPETKSCDVLVVGAGVSGLVAAHHLKKKDPSLRVTVLEAKDRVGGRTCGLELKTINGQERFDLGGQWVSSSQPHVQALLAELGLETYLQHTEGTRLVQIDSGSVGRYEGQIPALPWYALIDLHLLMRKVEKLCRMVPAADPSLCVHAREWDAITLDHFLRKHTWTKTVHSVITVAGRTIFGVEPTHCSLLYFLHYMSAAGGLEPIISNDYNGGQEAKVKGGAFQISELLAKQIGEDNLHLATPVICVDQTQTLVRVTTKQGEVYECNYVIMAIPPQQAVGIEFCPILPPEKLHVLHRMPAGNLMKVIITYKVAFWRNSGMAGTMLTSGGPSKHAVCSAGPVGLVEDACLANGSPALVLFVGGQQQQEHCKLSASERRQAVLDSLVMMVGPEALDYLDYVEKDWNLEPYNGGCPVNVGTPGMMTQLVPGLRTPFHKVHFAGTESATVWCGFINGAVQAGLRAANEVLYDVRPQAISVADLADTCYGPDPADKWNLYQGKRRRRKRVLRWTLSIGGICMCIVIAKKAYFRIAF